LFIVIVFKFKLSFSILWVRLSTIKLSKNTIIVFLESLIVLNLFRYAQLHHSADSWSRSCDLVAF